MNNERNKKKEVRTYIIACLLLFIPVLQYAACYSYTAGTLEDKTFVNVINTVNKVLPNNLLSLEYIKSMPIQDIGQIAFIFFVICLAEYIDRFEIRWASMQGKESGSAKFNTNMKAYNKKYVDTKNPSKNMVLAQDLFLSMDGRKTLKNNNILVIGGSGAGKSRFMVKPNILQNAGYSSFVVTDPSGELLQSTGHLLEKQGYKIKVFNLSDMQHSCCFNPFCYIENETSVRTMIDCYMKNTSNGKSGGDPFWEKSETALLMACALYLIEVGSKEEQNFAYIAKLVENARIEDEDDPEAKSTLDFMMEELADINPDSPALKYYGIFKQATGKTAKSILVSTAVRLADFNNISIKNLTSTDNLELEKMGDEKTALFVVIPTANTTFNYLVAMMYTQLFETLYHVAEHSPGLRLNVPVRFLLDEFANIGQIPDFDKLLATMRKYEISCTIILQNLAQLKSLYKDAWETIIGNCDTTIFLGGSEQNTLEYISKMLGKATIRVRNTSGGRKGGGGYSRNASARDLMTPDEVGRMAPNMSIVKIRTEPPFLIKKYDYPKHPNYKYTGDANPNFLYKPEDHFDTSNSAGFKKVEGIVTDKIDFIKTSVSEIAEEIRIKDEAMAIPEINDLDEKLLQEMNVDSVEEFEQSVKFDESFDADFEFSMDRSMMDKIEEIKDEDNFEGFVDDVYRPDDSDDDNSGDSPLDYVDTDVFSMI